MPTSDKALITISTLSDCGTVSEELHVTLGVGAGAAGRLAGQRLLSVQRYHMYP